MIEGLLLDSHTLLWLDGDIPLGPDAIYAIGVARARRRLFVSDISLWELGVACHLKSFERRPNLRGMDVAAWFHRVTVNYGIRVMHLTGRIAAEAAEVPGRYGSGDPGDCFLIATARIRKLSLATHDTRMIALAKREPDYLQVTIC